MTAPPAPPRSAVPAHILIAEDSPTQAHRLMHILQQHGYQASAASNGREALEMAERLQPALIISDVVMPEIDGYALTRLVKSRPDLAGIPVILVTTMSDPQDVIRGLECGADCFILKPYDEEHLIGRIQYILLNRQFRRVNDAGMGVEIHFNGQRHYITADRLQILDLLLSTYDAAIQRNQQLSESKQALELTTAEMQAGHRFLDSMIENLPVPILIQDATQMRYVRLNRAAEDLFGRSKGELIGKTAFDLFPAAEAEVFATEGRRVLRERSVENIEWMTVHTRHRGMRKLHTKMVPVLDAFGESSHLLVMCDDVTANVQAAAELKGLNEELLRNTEELERARAAAEEGTRAKSAFLAAMSHEIRTPMNGVIGMVDVLHQSSLRGDQVEMVDLIRDSANSLLSIIEDILDFSKIEAGKLETEAVPMGMEDVMEKACGLLDKLALKKCVELTLFSDPAMPALVYGDALRVRQVLINLVNNAIKFSSGEGRHGRVAVRADLADGPNGQVLALTVRDNGIGIDDHTRARLFTSFAQADASTTRRFGGTGLGLAISHRLVHLMGGDVHVHSAPDRGATFTVHLPCKPVEPATQAARIAHLDGLRCIVIGERGVRDDYAAYLRHEGMRVERVRDVAAALQRMRDAPEPAPVYVVETRHAPELADALAGAAEGSAGLPPAGVVLVERGRRRHWRKARSGWTVLDGNVLSRRRFVRGVAVAAGRLPEEVTVPVVAQVGEAGRPITRAQAVRQGRLVLVAEDNETNQKVIQRQLALLGIAADIVGNGRAALERWRGAHYAALLTDVHMPVMDGYELTATIRAEEAGKRRIPIVGLSANAVKDESQRCRTAGMDDYLSKPVRLQLLDDTLARHLPPVAPRAMSPAAPIDTRVPAQAMQAPLDATVLELLVGSDPALVDEFLQEFRRGAADALQNVQEAARDRGVARIGDVAHRLKASAAAVGATALHDLCEQLEMTCDTHDWASVEAVLRAFGQEIQRVDKHLDAL